jgi:hypothetical protein
LTEAGRWDAFPVNPSDDYRREELQQVFTAIIEEAQKITQRSLTVHLVNNSTATPHSARNDSSRPDAYLLMDTKKIVSSQSGVTRDSWDDIAVSFEFKKENSPSERIDVCE